MRSEHDGNMPEEPLTKESATNEKTPEQNKNNRASAIRRLIVFQFKLLLDAIRDITLSPVSLILSVIDIANGRYGKDTYFEKLMEFGRVTESKINLFEQNESEPDAVESMLGQVESVIVKEYKDKQLSQKTYRAIEKIIRPPSK